MRILVILPTYNEAENVLSLVEQILAHEADIDVLVVDDNSPDGTGEIVARAGEANPHLHLLRRPGKLGLGGAYLSGFRFAMDHGYDLIFTMDCDHSHDPRYLPDFLIAMRDHDLVIGSRYIRGGGIDNWPWHRQILSRFANLYARFLLRLPVRDCTSGYRCYRRVVLESVDAFSIRSSGYSFLEEFVLRVHRAGFSIGEVPIVFVQRTAGVSKIDSSEIYRAAWHVLRSAVFPPRVSPSKPRTPEQDERPNLD